MEVVEVEVEVVVVVVVAVVGWMAVGLPSLWRTAFAATCAFRARGVTRAAPPSGAAQRLRHLGQPVDRPLLAREMEQVRRRRRLGEEEEEVAAVVAGGPSPARPRSRSP